jgi:HEAT repeat protein
MVQTKRVLINHSRHLFTLLCLCFAAAILGDSTAEALLLAHSGPSILPRMFLVNAVALFIVSALLMSIIDRIDRGALFLFATVGHGALLLVIRLALASDTGWLYPLLFSYAYIAKVLLFLLFWTIANDLIDSRSARQRFPVIAAGGTLGAITVAFAIPLIVRYCIAENLLIVWSALLLTAAVFFLPLRKRTGNALKPVSDHERHRRRTLKSMAGDIKLVAGDPLLSGMAIVYGLVFFLLIVQHYFFYVSIKERFVTSDDIAAFLGIFTGTSMAVTLVLQFTTAGAVLRRFGSTRALLILPITLITVFFIQAITPRFAPAASMALLTVIVTAMGLRIAVFDSFFSPNFQLFFSSLPGEIRGRAKLALEGIIKPAAILMAGLWLLFGAPRCSFSLNMALCLVVAVFLAIMTHRLKARYASSLRRFLAGVANRSFLTEISRGGVTSSLVTPIKKIFTEGDFEVQKFLIDELVRSSSPELVALVLEQARHSDHRVRATVVAAIGGAVTFGEARGPLLDSLKDSDVRVVANAVIALGRYANPAMVPIIEPFLTDPHGRVRANAAMALWRCGERDKLPALCRCLEEMLDGTRPEECASALFALGDIDAEETGARLVRFAAETGHRQLKERAQVYRQLVAALAKKQDTASIDALVILAKDADRRQRRLITSAFASLLTIGVPCKTLLDRLSSKEPLLAHIVIRAVQESGIRLSGADAGTLRAFVRSEIAEIMGEYASCTKLASHCDRPPFALLRYAIEEESVEIRKHTVACALSLFDAAAVIGPVVPRLFHHDPHIRARAFEALENAGDIALNRKAIAAIDYKEPSDNVPIGKAPIGDIVALYVDNSNGWVSRCATFAREALGGVSDTEKAAKLLPSTAV